MNITSFPDMNVSSEPRTAPARSRSETRRRLVDAATHLFARSGVHGVTSHEIARAAGVAAGTFYLHFQDKEALFREVVFEAALKLRSRMERAGGASPDPGVVVRARAEELLAFAEENRSLVQILFGRNHEAGVAAQALVGMRARIVAWWAEAPGRIPREAVIESLVRIQVSGIYFPGAGDEAAAPQSPRLRRGTSRKEPPQ